MKNLLLLYAVLGVLLLGAAGCYGDETINPYPDPNPTPTEEAKILSFEFTAPVQATGTIDQNNRTISISVPQGTDLTNVSGNATVSSGASLNPNLSAGVDFSGLQRIFTVTNGGVSNVYTVIVDLV